MQKLITLWAFALQHKTIGYGRAFEALLKSSFRPYYMLLPLSDNRRVKSGTLTGVYSYAGYFLTDKQPDSFVLILNQNKNHRDRLLDILEDIHSLPSR